MAKGDIFYDKKNFLDYDLDTKIEKFYEHFKIENIEDYLTTHQRHRHILEMSQLQDNTEVKDISVLQKIAESMTYAVQYAASWIKRVPESNKFTTGEKWYFGEIMRTIEEMALPELYTLARISGFLRSNNDPELAHYKTHNLERTTSFLFKMVLDKEAKANPEVKKRKELEYHKKIDNLKDPKNINLLRGDIAKMDLSDRAQYLVLYGQDEYCKRRDAQATKTRYYW